MRSKDRIHAEHLANRKQGVGDEKTWGIKASTLIPRDEWNRTCCYNEFPGQEQSNHSETHITPAAPALLTNLESRRIDHEPITPHDQQFEDNGVAGQRSCDYWCEL